MAKKTDKKEAPAPVSKPVAVPRKQQPLFRAGLAYAVIAIAVLLVLQAAVGWMFMRETARQQEALSAALLKHVQAEILAFERNREAAVDAMAANPAPLLAALVAGNARALEPQLQAEAPGAIQVRLSPAVINPEDRSLSYAQQDLVTRTVQAGKGLPPEISFVDDARVVIVARALRGATGIEGVVLASYPFKPLADSLHSYDPSSAKLDLVLVSDHTVTLASAGESVTPAYEPKAYTTANPNWELDFAPAEGLGKNMPMALLWGLLMAGVLAVAALFVFALKTLNQRLDSDLVSIDNFNENFLRFGQRDKPALAFSNFGNMLFHLEQYANELRAGKGLARAKEPSLQEELASIDLLGSDATDMLGGAPAPKAAAATRKAAAAPAKPAAASARLPAEIFRAYDVRGRVGSTLTPDIVRLLGLAIGSEVAAKGEQAVVVGRDARLSSPELFKSLLEGLQASGRDVIDVGTVPTPVLYFAAKTLGPTSAVMLTGSHNPPEDNGLKIVIAGQTLAGDEIKALKTRIEKQDFSSGTGGYSQQSVSADYIERIASDVVLARPFRVVVDGGNGVAGLMGVRVLEALGCDVVPLFCEPDGHFPNHHPDPAKPENLEDLQRAVAANDAQLGVAFDGDGDRLGVVTPAGKIIYTDRLLMLLAQHVLISSPGADIVFDVKCSRDLVSVITAAGGRPVMNRTGHSYLKAKLAETGAPLAGEMSGHIILNDRWFGFDDALYAAARVLEILSLEPADADAVFAELPESVSTPEISIPVPEEFKQPFMAALTKKASFKDGTINTLDGLRVDFADGWGLVRASNTTASLVARFEGRDQTAFTRVKDQFRTLLLSVEPELELPF